MNLRGLRRWPKAILSTAITGAFVIQFQIKGRPTKMKCSHVLILKDICYSIKRLKVHTAVIVLKARSGCERRLKREEVKRGVAHRRLNSY